MFNGLRVITRQTDQHIPAVVLVTCYFHGARDAKNIVLAEVLKRYLEESINERISPTEKALYVNRNAPSPREATCYSAYVPRELLPAWLSLERERMRGINLTQTKLNLVKVEMMRDLVEERRDTKQAIDSTINQFFDKQHPLVSNKIIALDQVTLSQVSDFYTRVYAPENAIFMIAGGVEKEYYIGLMARIFSTINRQDPNSSPRNRRPPVIAKQDAGTWTFKISNLALPRVAWHWPIYNQTNDDRFDKQDAAIMVLKTILKHKDFGIIEKGKFFSGRDVIAFETAHVDPHLSLQRSEQAIEIRFVLNPEKYLNSENVAVFLEDFSYQFQRHLISSVTDELVESAKQSLIYSFFKQDSNQARPILQLLPYTLTPTLNTSYLSEITTQIADITPEDVLSVANYLLLNDPYVFIFLP